MPNHIPTNIEYLEIMGLRSHIAPIAFWIHASDYLASSRELPVQPAPPDQPSRYFLPCRAVELSLKAFLSWKGMTIGELASRTIGHDLEAALTEAEKRGLWSIVAEINGWRDAIVNASHYYRYKVLEYPAIGEALGAYSGLPDTAPLVDFTDELLRAIHQSCLTA